MKKESVKRSDRLLRRVQYRNPHFIKEDGTPASSSFSLKKGEEGLSVDIERLTTHAKSVQDKTRFRLFALEASYTMDLGLENVHAPLTDNYAHALIKGSITRGVARKLARNSLRVL